MMDHVMHGAHHPLVAIMGGAKVSDKVEVVGNLLGRVDALLNARPYKRHSRMPRLQLLSSWPRKGSAKSSRPRGTTC